MADVVLGILMGKARLKESSFVEIFPSSLRERVAEGRMRSVLKAPVSSDILKYFLKPFFVRL